LAAVAPQCECAAVARAAQGYNCAAALPLEHIGLAAFAIACENRHYPGLRDVFWKECRETRRRLSVRNREAGPGKSAELAETDANWYSIADRLSRERFSVCERDVTPRCEACG